MFLVLLSSTLSHLKKVQLVLVVFCLSASVWGNDTGEYLPIDKKATRQAERGEFPYLVSLKKTWADLSSCGGVIVHEEWAVVAAHCVLDKEKNRMWKDADVNVIPGGIVDQTAFFKNSRAKLDIDNVVVHKEYDPVTKKNDIAMVKVKGNLLTPIRSNNPIHKALVPQVIPLATPVEKDSFLRKVAKVTGYGGESNKLDMMSIHILPEDDCVASFSASFDKEKMICAGLKSKENIACLGTSASVNGPLVVEGKLVGLISFGSVGICDSERTPGSYTRISAFNDFINDVINGKYE